MAAPALPANHILLGLVALGAGIPAAAIALVASVITKGWGALGVFNWVEGALEKATRRGNRCNAGTGRSAVDPALKRVLGSAIGDV